MPDDDDGLKEKNGRQKVNKKNKGTKKTPWYSWGIKIFVLSFILTIFFSFFTEIIISSSTAIVCVIVVLVLLAVSIIADVLAVAVTSCPMEPFLAMAADKVKGAKTAVKMCKNSHKVSSICGDVIGDICGIISGSAGATLVFIILSEATSVQNIIYSILISSVIASFTVGGKGFCKPLAVKYNQKIVFFFARIFSVFSKGK